MLRKIIRFFDRLEDKIRGKLSHYPILYAFLGGIGIVLFWRGVWHMADEAELSSTASIILGMLTLLLTGVFVSAFIGNKLIISGISGGKKLTEKESGEIELEIKTEEERIKSIQDLLNRVETKVSHLEEDMHHK